MRQPLDCGGTTPPCLSPVGAAQRMGRHAEIAWAHRGDGSVGTSGNGVCVVAVADGPGGWGSVAQVGGRGRRVHQRCYWPRRGRVSGDGRRARLLGTRGTVRSSGGPVGRGCGTPAGKAKDGTRKGRRPARWQAKEKRSVGSRAGDREAEPRPPPPPRGGVIVSSPGATRSGGVVVMRGARPGPHGDAQKRLAARG